MKKRMNTKAGIGIMVLFISICFVPAMAGAFAQGNGERGNRFDGKGQQRSLLGIWRNPQIVEKLQLTDPQVDQLRDLDFAHRERQQALKAQLDSLRLQMDKAMNGDNVDKASVRQTAQKIADVKGDMFVEKTETRLAFQDILTVEQTDMLQLDRMNTKRKGIQQGKKQMKGQRWAQNLDCQRYSDDFVE